MGPPTSEPIVYLVDGTSQLFRAYFAIRGLTNAEGLPTNAVFGFTNMLRKLIADEQPDYLVVAFDLPGPVFRNEQYADYKAHRPPSPEDLNLQVPYAKRACEVLGVPYVEQPGFEADDLIATYAARARSAGMPVVVVASDKDLLQLVGPGVTVLNPSKNQRLDEAGVASSFGVPPERVRDVLGLMGDAVDNIPGVPGVGEKTALMCASIYGDVEAIVARAGRFVAAWDARDALLEAIQRIAGANPLEHAEVDTAAARADDLDAALRSFVELEADESMRERVSELRQSLSQTDFEALRGSVGGSGKSAARPLAALKKQMKSLDRGSSRRIWYAILEHADQARMSKELATLRADAPAELEIEDLRLRPPRREEAHALFGSLGFGSLTAEFAGEPADAADAVTPEKGTAYSTVLTREAATKIVDACRRAGTFALRSFSPDADPMRGPLLGLSVSHAENQGAYFPVGHDHLGAPRQWTPERLAEVLGPLLADARVGKAGHRLKHDEHVLRRHGLPVRGWNLDVAVAAFLLNSSRSSYATPRLAEEFLGRPAPGEDHGDIPETQEQASLIEVERMSVLAAEQADLTLRLARDLVPRMEELGVRELYDTVDGPLLPVLARMEAHGIGIDTALLARMSQEMESSLDRTRDEIHRLAGEEFNVDSPKQLREVLFDKLGLKPRRKTAKSRVASTDAQTLEDLSGEHPIAGRILEYRELAKLKGTYVDSLPGLVHPETGRVHTSFDPTGAATGRLSSSDPNLQNIPVRSEAGRRVRAAFVPRRGYRFLASDYSQVELRVLAHICGDETLIAAFRAGEDIHRFTASQVFGVDPSLVSDTMRRRAKAVNFGILYGMSETRLAREQGIKRSEAREFIRAYFDRFAKIRGYIDRVREQALRDAAVRTLFGRVRFFPQLHQRVNRAVQEQALRAAVNTTIQGTAADLMKMAMLRVDEQIEQAGLGARMLLQVHDELLLEVPQAEVEATGGMVRRAMEEVYRLDVPLAVDQKVGDNWLEVT